jgi:hypothetical protein
MQGHILHYYFRAGCQCTTGLHPGRLVLIFSFEMNGMPDYLSVCVRACLRVSTYLQLLPLFIPGRGGDCQGPAKRAISAPHMHEWEADTAAGLLRSCIPLQACQV